jgi:hypothetical protein
VGIVSLNYLWIFFFCFFCVCEIPRWVDILAVLSDGRVSADAFVASIFIDGAKLNDYFISQMHICYILILFFFFSENQDCERNSETDVQFL